MNDRRRNAGVVAKIFGGALLLALPGAASARGSDNRGTLGAVDRPTLTRIDRWASPIKEASARFGIPEAWIRRVIGAESGGRTSLDGRSITSRAGAMGLMQLMPGTWAEMRATHGLGSHPHDPRDNILAGTAYLRAMFDRFGYPGLFAAYNAGPARYAEHLAGRRRLPVETVAYVAEIGFDPTRATVGIIRAPAAPGLFVSLRHLPSGHDEPHPPPAASDGLFAPIGLDFRD